MPLPLIKIKNILLSLVWDLKKQKNGYGTALLKELCNFGEKFGYEYLEIECPNPDCQAFMKKLGFKDEFYLPIDQLKKSIQAYELSKQAKVSLL
ncbi:GNAT family N-acetyltransferase [Acinetobacter baumannii]|uniref:GNAT family N-acetyltransferase n=1 Tax=Acinetobacter baumannii TaxID=470 RepID=UPI0025A2E966|nr:GNAT family N-acetyltransferase [Acinetobacter baumannii]